MLLFRRQAVIPAWIFVFGLVAFLAPPSGLANGVILLIVFGLVVPVMALWLWTDAAQPTIAGPELQPLDVAIVGRGWRRRRGSRRRDEGRP